MCSCATAMASLLSSSSPTASTFLFNESHLTSTFKYGWRISALNLFSITRLPNEKNLQVKTFFRILVRIYSFSRQVRAGVRSVRGYTIPSPGDLFRVFQLTILNPTKEGLIAGTTSTWTTGRHSPGHRFCFPFNLIRDYGRSFRPARIVEKRLGVSKESGCEESSPGIPE